MDPATPTPPSLLSLIRALIVALTATVQKWGVVADSVNGCVIELDQDADKVTDAVKAFKIKVF